MIIHSIKKYRYAGPFLKTLLISSVALTGCSDYLDVTPKGEIIPETVADYDLLFNGTVMTNLAPTLLEISTDNGYSDMGTDAQGSAANAYFWNMYLDDNTEGNPQIWLNAYKSVYYSNVVIRDVMDATGGSEAEKRSLMGQALTVRAMSYFYLLTAFANAYDPAVNPDELGVSLTTEINVAADAPPRSTLKVCFDQLTGDIQQALEWLPEQHKDRWRVTKYGAAGLLARIYLYMHDYEQAQHYASLALESPQENKLLDYNNFDSYSDFPRSALNPEKAWFDYTVVVDRFSYTQDLVSLFSPEDLRLSLFTATNADGFVFRAEQRTNAGISYPELYLTLAECHARSGQVADAIAVVNNLREHRLPETAEGREVAATTDEEALELVLAERRRELVATSTRWMDMKRLAMEGRMPAVHRYPDNDPSAAPLRTLEPGSPNYTFEIPRKVLAFNTAIQPNHQ